jgi:putative chitobiose transport system permease protein
MLPAIRPALITLAIFTFVSAWGDFLWPLLMVDKPELYTLPLGVATLESAFSQDWRLITAGSVLALFPLLLLFVWVQKYIIPSDVVTGIKG